MVGCTGNQSSNLRGWKTGVGRMTSSKDLAMPWHFYQTFVLRNFLNVLKYSWQHPWYFKRRAWQNLETCAVRWRSLTWNIFLNVTGTFAAFSFLLSHSPKWIKFICTRDARNHLKCIPIDFERTRKRSPWSKACLRSSARDKNVKTAVLAFKVPDSIRFISQDAVGPTRNTCTVQIYNFTAVIITARYETPQILPFHRNFDDFILMYNITLLRMRRT